MNKVEEHQPFSTTENVEVEVDTCSWMTKEKTIRYKCYFIGILPFFYISDCIRCGICFGL